MSTCSGEERAFPALESSEGWEHKDAGFGMSHESAGGLTKREWLVGICAQGILAGTSCREWPRTFDRFENGRKVETMAQWLAVNAVQAADAILEEMNRPPAPDVPNPHADEVVA